MGFIADALGIHSKDPNINNTQYQASIGNQLNTLETGQQNQQHLAQALQAMAAGQGPNLGQTQLQAAQNQNAQQAAGMIGSQKGINPGLASQQILRNYGMANQNAANQSAQLQQQQQLGAMQEFGNLASQQVTGANQGLGLLTQAQNAQNANLNQNAQSNAGATGGLLGGIAKGAAALFSSGGLVGGSEEVPGDSPQNDNVPALLSAGEIIVPKEVVEGRPEDSAKFIEAIKAHKDEGNPQGYAKVLAAHRHLHERVSALESHMKKGKKE